MDVSEQAEEQKTAESGVPESIADPAPRAGDAGPQMPPPLPERPAPATTWLRLAYAFEFWIALIAVFTVWSEAGGQGHMDLVAWYLKLSCGVALAYCGVKMTSAMAEKPKAWNRSSMKWFAAVLVISALVIGITYWYHLHEVSDEPDTDENSATSVSNRPAQRNFKADAWDQAKEPMDGGWAPGPRPLRASRSNIPWS